MGQMIEKIQESERTAAAEEPPRPKACVAEEARMKVASARRGASG